ncbi:MAG: TRAP transporter small permease [Eubacteriaceae bacterium]
MKFFIKILDKFLQYLNVFFLILLILTVFSGIISRYINFNIVFSEEFGKYFFIWVCMIGIAIAAREDAHIRIDYFILKTKINNKLSTICRLIFFLVFSLIMTYLGFKLTIFHFSLGKTTIGIRFPIFLFTAALPIGFSLTSLSIYISMIQKIFDYKQ